MQKVQTFKNHARFDPPYHFFIALVLLVNVFVVAFTMHRGWHLHPLLAVWRLLVAVALLMLALKTRAYPLAAQDRVIRLEERLRYAELLPPGELAGTSSLSVAQIVALRFASDAELPGLVRRALSENLTPKQIKESITDWRADYTRV